MRLPTVVTWCQCNRLLSFLSVWVGSMAVIRLWGNLKQPPRSFRGRMPRPCVKIPACFERADMMGTDALSGKRTHVQTGFMFPNASAHAGKEITSKSTGQLFSTHAHTPPIKLLCLISLLNPSDLCYPMWSRWTTASLSLPFCRSAFSHSPHNSS